MPRLQKIKIIQNSEKGMFKYIIGLDPATTTGFAVWDGCKIVNSGVIDCKEKVCTHRGAMEFGKRLLAGLNELPVSIISDVVVENSVAQFLKSKRAIEVQIGAITIIRLWASQHNFGYFEMEPMTIKKEFTGAGNADKSMMLLKAKQYVFRVKDHNEADAIAIAVVGSKIVTDETPKLLTVDYLKRKYEPGLA